MNRRVCLTVAAGSVVGFSLAFGAASQPAPKSAAKDAKTSVVEIWPAAGPTVPVTAVAFPPDGRTLAVGGYREVVLWDLAEAKLARRLEVGDGLANVRAVAFLQNGAALAVAGGRPGVSGTVRVLDVASGQVVRTLGDAKDELTCLAVSVDGKFLAAGGADNRVFIWELAEGKLVQTLTDHSDRVTALDFSADGKYLLSAGADRTVRLWTLGEWKPFRSLPQPEPVVAAAFSPDSRFIGAAINGVSASSIRLLNVPEEPPPEPDAKAGTPPAPRKPERPALVRAIDTGTAAPLGLVWATVKRDATPPGKAAKPPTAPAPPAVSYRMVVPCNDRLVRVFNTFNTDTVATLRGHRDWVYCAALSPDGAKLATAGADGAVNIWTARDGVLLATLVQLTARRDDWMILTPHGHFASSVPEKIHATEGGQPLAAADVARRFHHPEFVREVLADTLPSPDVYRPAPPPTPTNPTLPVPR